MRLWMLVLISMVLSGCSLLPTKTILLGGVEDVVNVNAGGKVCNVSLPTDEPGKTYCIVTKKAMQLISLDAQNRMEKECK